MKQKVDIRPASELIAEILARLLDGASQPPTVVLGPVVTDPIKPGSWCFVMASGNEQMPTADDKRFWFDSINSIDKPQLELFLANVILELSKLSALEDQPIIVHTFDDELIMAEWCEVIWPCAKITGIREAIQAERRQGMI